MVRWRMGALAAGTGRMRAGCELWADWRKGAVAVAWVRGAPSASA